MSLIPSRDSSLGTSLDSAQRPFPGAASGDALPAAPDVVAVRAPRPASTAAAAVRAPRLASASATFRVSLPAPTHGVFGDPLASSASSAAAPAGAPTPAPTEAFDPRARTAGILLLQCGMLLLIGLASRSWFTGPGGELGVLGIEECRGAVCHTLSWLDAEHAPAEVQALSVLALLGGLVAVGFMLQAGVVLLTGTPSPRVLRGLGISLGVAALGLASFYVLFSVGEHARGVQASWAGILAILAVTGAWLLLHALVRPLARGAAPAPSPSP